MTTLSARIKESLKEKAKQHVEDNDITYRSLSHFVEVAMKELIKQDERKAKVQ